MGRRVHLVTLLLCHCEQNGNERVWGVWGQNPRELNGGQRRDVTPHVTLRSTQRGLGKDIRLLQWKLPIRCCCGAEGIQRLWYRAL